MCASSVPFLWGYLTVAEMPEPLFVHFLAAGEVLMQVQGAPAGVNDDAQGAAADLVGRLATRSQADIRPVERLQAQSAPAARGQRQHGQPALFDISLDVLARFVVGQLHLNIGVPRRAVLMGATTRARRVNMVESIAWTARAGLTLAAAPRAVVRL